MTQNIKHTFKRQFPKLFVTDLDGTALGGGFQPYARFPDHFSVFLDRLASRGCQWAINTTWDVNGQWQLVLSSSVRSRPSFLMGEYGRSLARCDEKGPEIVEPYAAKMEQQIQAVNHKYLIPLMQDICSRFEPKKIHFYGHLFHFICIEEQIKEMQTYLDSRPAPTELSLQYGNGTLVAHPAMLEKGLVLAEVLRLTGLQPDEVVVAGDQTPDISMMQSSLALHIVCPDNAHEAVKGHVLANGGSISSEKYGKGIVQSFTALAKRNDWEW